MLTDLELLERYGATACEAAFSELVARHVDLVYSTALRLVGGDEHLARDVAQSVFVDLARKASRLGRTRSRPGGMPDSSRADICLPGWLYTSARFAASKAVRADQTRRRYEQEAQAMKEMHQGEAKEGDWPATRLVLDEAMDHLCETDRDAIVLRFFEGKDLHSVGAVLGLTEEAARKRIRRALDKLRDLLAQRGVASSSMALAAVLNSHAIQAAPAGLAQALAGAVLSATAASTVAAPTLIQLMVTTKAKLTLGALAVLTLAAPWVIQRHNIGHLREQNRLLQKELSASASDQVRNASREPDAPEVARRPASVLPAPATVPPLPWPKVESGDFRGLMSQLRALGVPEDTIHDVVLANVDQWFGQKKRQVLAQAVVKDEFWKPGGQSRTVGPELTDQLKALGMEKVAMIRDLLGLETDQREFMKPFSPRDVDDDVESNWRFVSEEKRAKIKELTVAFRREIPENPDWGGEKYLALEDQFEANLAQILSPSEWEEHALRRSALASRLQMELREFNPTETEFRSLFTVLREFGRDTTGHSISPEDLTADRQALANPKLRERLATILSSERLVEFDQKFQTTLLDMTQAQ